MCGTSLSGHEAQRNGTTLEASRVFLATFHFFLDQRRDGIFCEDWLPLSCLVSAVEISQISWSSKRKWSNLGLKVAKVKRGLLNELNHLVSRCEKAREIAHAIGEVFDFGQAVVNFSMRGRREFPS